MLMAGALSTVVCGQAMAETPRLEKIKERWEKRQGEKAEMREKLEAELKKQDTELEKVQSDLKSASGEKKIDALTAAVNTLIEQRRHINKQMEQHLEKAKERGMKKGLPGGEAMPSPSVAPEPVTP
jgi:CCR4-NOT transcriptional regulation complex NOT5 subunit